MTAIAGYEVAGGVVLAADSAICDGETVTVTADKLFRVGPIGIAVCGNARIATALRHRLKAKPPKNTDAVPRWIERDLVPAVQAVAEEVLGDEEPDYALLVAVRGLLFVVDDDGTQIRAHEGMAALGSGRAFVLGAMHALSGGASHDAQRSVSETIARLRTAISAAAYHSPHCALPVRELWVAA